MPSTRLPYLTSKLQGFGTTIFTEMTLLAQKYDAVNLGQGFPNFDGPEEIREAAADAVRGSLGTGHNQYCRMYGIPELNAAVAEHQRRFWRLDYEPETEVTVTSGATEALAATLQALCETGDEVIIFEPFYDSYRAGIAMAGAVDRVYTLEAPDFRIEEERLAKLVGAKTRAILLNTPHNPTGRVFGREELDVVAGLARRHDLLVISDEVYEHLVYEDSQHIPIATLPGMRERTVTISSAGKTFSFTGWKVGWACAPPEITKAIRTAHQFLTFCNSAPFQPAVARALALPDDFYDQLRSDYLQRRDFLCRGLTDAGFDVLTPRGAYFVLADVRPLGWSDDVEFCRMLPEKVGVAAIPPTAFYVNKDAGRHLVRFAFCKTRGVLEEAIERLAKLGARR